ncbi:MAG: DUF1552 domain-containing protein [Roseibacillus sp.]|nr:DUF1552 domain-containing protein [Roseibacillus sp.]
MMTARRGFLKRSLMGTGAMALMGAPRLLASPEKPPMRFIFMHRGNGLWPKVMVPPGIDAKTREKEDRKDPYELDLDSYDLPDWMAPLSAHKENLTILQGLSGMMCTTGHHSWCSSLGAFKANERLGSIRWATVDFELAKLFPSPVNHVELACFPEGGGNAKGTLDGIATGFSASGPQKPNYAFGSPRVAMEELFKSVSQDASAQTKYQIDRQVLEFVARNEGAAAAPLGGVEKAKVRNYADSVEVIRERNRKIDEMAEVIRRHVPTLDPKYLNPGITTIDRQIGHTEVLLGALISGLTNVAAFTVDELGHRYTGFPGLEGMKLNMHDVGHNKVIGGLSAEVIRQRCRTHHMSLIDRMVTRLKSVPEAGGTMFDNTMIFYFPDGGETHHSRGTEYPFVVMAGDNTRVDLRRRYVRLPNYGQAGHRTLGNWYTTLLNAYGNPIQHFGALDNGLLKFGHDQTGAISDFLG